MGRAIAAKAGERLAGCALELGGKNPLLVLGDADFRKAAEGTVRACFVGAGQVCISTERVHVDESIYARFLELNGPDTQPAQLQESGFPYITARAYAGPGHFPGTPFFVDYRKIRLVGGICG